MMNNNNVFGLKYPGVKNVGLQCADGNITRRGPNTVLLAQAIKIGAGSSLAWGRKDRLGPLLAHGFPFFSPDRFCTDPPSFMTFLLQLNQ